MAGPAEIRSHERLVEELRAKEQARRYDHSVLGSMSEKEAAANTLFAAVRDSEVARVWNAEGDLEHEPGMGFYKARDHGMGHEETGIWRVIRKMPKGALLHCHFDGTVDVRFLLGRALSTPNMAMKSSQALCTQDDLFSATIEFLVLPESQERSALSIYSHDYVPGTWVSYADARNSFPLPHPYVTKAQGVTTHSPPYLFPADANGPSSPSGLSFDASVHSLMTMTPHAGLAPITNSRQAWAKFQSTFGVIQGLLGYEPTLKAYTKELLLSHARDGIHYTETRINFLEEFMVRSNGSYDLSHAEWVQLYIEAVQEAQLELGSDVRVDAKIIYTTVRFVDNAKLRWYLEDCLSLKQQYPDWIVGFDLVGHEDPLRPLKYYIPELLRFQSRCKEVGVEIPFVFHAGETLEDGGDADLNLYDALVLGTKRIGHGVSLARHPVLTDMVKDRDICIELCPISNQVLGYTSSIAAHPSLLALLSRNIPVALSSDDPAIFENFGLSYDFYQLAISSKATTLVSLGHLARQSIRYSLTNAEEKKEMAIQFERQWQAFISWMLQENHRGSLR